jgi:hypothetical protein
LVTPRLQDSLQWAKMPGYVKLDLVLEKRNPSQMVKIQVLAAKLF